MKNKNLRTLTFFNNKGGVGKTSLAYHVSWMLTELGNKVLSVDLDPQANLTGMFMPESRLEHIMEEKKSVYSSLEPLMKGTGDVQSPDIIPFGNNTQDITNYKQKNTEPEQQWKGHASLGLLPGDLKLSSVEGEFSSAWPECLDKKERAFRVTTAFSRLIHKAGVNMSADWAVIDMGPNLGAINRAVLIASDYVVFPLGPDLFSYQGLKNVGEFLNRWRKEWNERTAKKPGDLELDLPAGNMTPVGYIMMRHSIRENRPVQSYQRWMDKMPNAYKEYVIPHSQTQSTNQSYQLAHLKDYRSLMPMAQEHNKPMFLLKPGDGAIGSHFQAVQKCYTDFKELTNKITSTIHFIGKGKKRPL